MYVMKGAILAVALLERLNDCIQHADQGTRKERNGESHSFVFCTHILGLVLLIALFVLAKYSGTEPAKGLPTEVKAPDKTDTIEGADSLATQE